MDDPAVAEAAIKNAIVGLWRREAELDGYEKVKLKSLMLNLKAFWLATCPPAPPPPGDTVRDRQCVPPAVTPNSG